jgi:hypothetical protein
VSAVDGIGDLLGRAQFEIPLGRFAHQGVLIAHFLSPIDRVEPAAETPALGHRRAARAEDRRDLARRRVERADGGVGEADIGVHHDRLRAARGEEIAMRHTHRGMLMRRDDRLGQCRVRIAVGARHGFDDRRIIGTGIDEYMVDAEGLETPQQRFSAGDAGLPIVHPDIIGRARKDHKRSSRRRFEGTGRPRTWKPARAAIANHLLMRRGWSRAIRPAMS